MTTRVVFDAEDRRCLHDSERRYPYAYGYLAATVRGFLHGVADTERLRAVLEALDHELDGEAP